MKRAAFAESGRELSFEGNPEATAGVHEGQILAGKYRVDKVLGIGGMGVVVAAHHAQLDEKVAIKFLLPEMLKNPEIVARFAREARAAVKIKSEHVARVFDVGQLETGAPYMVMEFLDGGDLSGWIQQRGALPIDQAVDFVIQACVAIAEAHGLGIVHRDLKPANLFCVRRPDGQLSIKVLDFGISKLTEVAKGPGPSGASVTRTSAVMGSPLYMSPEQVQNSKDVDARTDIWSLGIVLFELLTGRVPFPGETFGEIAVKIAVNPPTSLRDQRPDAPAGLEAVLLRTFEKDRNRRYPNVAEFAVALLPFASKRAKAEVERITGTIQAAGLSASALALPPTPKNVGTRLSNRTTGGVTATTPPLLDPSVKPRRTGWVIGAIVAAAALVGGGGALALRGRGERTEAAVVPAPPTLATAPSAPSPETTTPLPRPSPSSPPEPKTTAAGATEPTAPPVSDSTPAPPSRPAAAPRPSYPSHASAPPPSAIPKSASPASAEKPKPNCNPPYVVDSAGHHQYKPECL